MNKENIDISVARGALKLAFWAIIGYFAWQLFGMNGVLGVTAFLLLIAIFKDAEEV